MLIKDLKSILNRFNLEEFPNLLNDWSGFIRRDIIEDRKKKVDLIDEIVQICSDEEIDKKVVAELDLISTIYHSNKKKWSVYEFEGYNDNENNNPDELFKKIKKLVRHSYKKNVVCMKLHREVMWLRFELVDYNRSTDRSKSHVVFVIYLLHTPFILMTNILSKVKDFIQEVMMTVLECEAVESIELTGSCVWSLAELAVNKNSQGAPRKYRLEKEIQKRKVQDMEHNTNIYNENESFNVMKKQYIVDTFGEETMPKLEKIEYELKTNFRGQKFAPRMETTDEHFRCTVKFEGSNVLEGIRNLVEAGIAEPPLRIHMAKVPTLRRNYLILAEKSEYIVNE